MLTMAVAASLAAPVLADGLNLAMQRVDVSQFPVVRVYVSAATGDGIPITGLDARAFELREDGKAVDGLQVEPIVDSQEPIATALVMDVSGSMNDDGKLDAAKSAASAFIDTLGAADSVTIVSFATDVKFVQDYASDAAVLKKAITGLTAVGDTALYDAVIQTAQRQAKQVQRRKAIVLITDGGDTKSKQTLPAAISQAQAAGSPLFVIGLGNDVKTDVLEQLAAGTGGQAVNVSDPAQLKQTFLSIGDQLRRQYVLRYTSRLASDDKPHMLAARVTYTGQQAAVGGTFSIPKVAAPLAVSGVPTGGVVNSPQHISVDLPGGAAQVQMLVDDQPRATLTNPPYAFDWDATRETPGQHRLVIRATDAQGQTTERTYIMNVAAPPAPTAAPPTVVPTPAPAAATAVPARPTVAPTVAPQATAAGGPFASLTSSSSPNWVALAIGGAITLLLLGLALLLWIASRRASRRTVVVPATAGRIDDDTQLVGVREAGSATWIRPSPPAGVLIPTPVAHLRVVHGGEQRDVPLDAPEITIGRDGAVTIPITDALASRNHARIFVEKGQFWIEDKDSLNGTQVNGLPIKRHRLTNDDKITIGQTTLTFVEHAGDDNRTYVSGGLQ
jgi:Ca-activated chloride channel homolog